MAGHLDHPHELLLGGQLVGRGWGPMIAQLLSKPFKQFDRIEMILERSRWVAADLPGIAALHECAGKLFGQVDRPLVAKSISQAFVGFDRPTQVPDLARYIAPKRNKCAAAMPIDDGQLFRQVRGPLVAQSISQAFVDLDRLTQVLNLARCVASKRIGNGQLFRQVRGPLVAESQTQAFPDSIDRL